MFSCPINYFLKGEKKGEGGRKGREGGKKEVLILAHTCKEGRERKGLKSDGQKRGGVLSGYKNHQTQEDLQASSRDQGSSLSSPRQNQIGNIHNEG